MTAGIGLNAHYAGGTPVFDVFNTWCQEQPGESYGEIPGEASSMFWDVKLETHVDPGNMDLMTAFQEVRALQASIPSAQALIQQWIRESRNPNNGTQTFSVENKVRNPNPMEVFGGWSSVASGRQGFLDTESYSEACNFLPGIIDQSITELQKFMTQLRNAFTRMAYVRTMTGAKMNAITEVHWSGHISTHMELEISSDMVKLHNDSVNLVLLTRWNWLNFASAVTGTALRLMAAAITGYGMLTALPIAYRLITDIISEMRSIGNQACYTYSG